VFGTKAMRGLMTYLERETGKPRIMGRTRYSVPNPHRKSRSVGERRKKKVDLKFMPQRKRGDGQ